MTMGYGIFSDIHGNLPALKAVALALEEEKIDKLFCAGDFIGYGADPHKCIEKVKSLGAVGFVGYHVWAVIG